MDSLGIRRGIVIDNRDPESRGRCKIFIPGLYPKEFAETPENLPWAEPAMSLFGGGWTSEKNSEFKETGVCSVPHMGTKGDGAQVWVFFDSNDIRYPVYFAVAQSGPGWFSRHNNQHVITTDNVKIIVDEYNNFKPVKTDDKSISKNLAGTVSNNDVARTQKDIMNIGGVSKISELYEASGGAKNTFDFISKAGGSNGLYGISNVCNNGLSSLGNFLKSSGGTFGLNQVMAVGSIEDIKRVLSGSKTASSEMKTAIETQYGSLNNFRNELSQIGGINGFESIVGKFGSYDSFSEAIDGIGGFKGLNAMAEMEDSLGGASNYKEWTDGFKNGSDSVNDLIDGKTAEDRQAEIEANAQEIEDETITKSDTNVADSTNPAISNVVREGIKTRVRVEVVAPKKDNGNNDIAIDLKITGDVNLLIDGNLYKEVTGKTYETYHDDHYVNHMKGYHEVQNGDRYVQIDGVNQNIQTGLVTNMFKNGINQIVNSRYSTQMTNASYTLISDVVEIKSLGKLDITGADINMDSDGFMTISSSNGMSIVSRKEGLVITGDITTIEGSKHMMVTGSNVGVFGESVVDISSEKCIQISTEKYEEINGVVTAVATDDSIVIGTSNLNIGANIDFVMSSPASSTIYFGGILNYKFVGTISNYIDVVTIESNHTTTGIKNEIVTIASNETVGVAGTPGTKVTNVIGTNTETVSGLNTVNANGGFVKAVVGNNVETVTGTNTETITGLSTENVNGGFTKKVGTAFTESVATTGEYSKSVGTAFTETISGTGIYEVIASTISETASTIITITAPTSTLIMSPTVTMAGLVYTSAFSTAAVADTPGGAPVVLVPVITEA